MGLKKGTLLDGNEVGRLYQFIGYVAVFFVLLLAFVIVPKTKLLSVSSYHTLTLFLVISFTGVYFFIQQLNKEIHNLAISLYDVIFILLIGLIFLSSIWARNPVYAYNVGIQWIIFYCVYKLVQHFSFKEKQQHFLVLSITIFFILSLCIVTFLFLYTANYSEGLGSIFVADQFRLISKQYALHRNAISSFLVLGLGVPLYWFIKSATRKQIVISSAFLGFLAFVLMLTRSRGSLLAFVSILVLFYASNFFIKKVSFKKMSWSLLLVLLGMSAAFMLQADESTYATLLNPLYGVNSAEGDGRLQMWDISFQLISEKPWFGYGAGSWEFEYQKYGAGDLKNHNHSRYFYVHSHNYFIDILFSIGIFGLICFAYIIFFYPLKIIMDKIIRHQIKDIDYLAFIGILAFNIVALFYGTMYSNVNKYLCHPVVFFIFIGILNNKEKQLSTKISKGIPLVFIVVLTVFVIRLYNNNQCIYNYKTALENKDYISCGHYLNRLEDSSVGFIYKKQSLNGLRTQLYFKQKKYDLAEKSILKELEEHPYNFNTWKKLGDTHFKQKEYTRAKYSYEKALLYNCDYIPASIALLKTEQFLKNHKKVKALIIELKYIDSYIQQYELNETTWSNHRKLQSLWTTYKKYKKIIDGI